MGSPRYSKHRFLAVCVGSLFLIHFSQSYGQPVEAELVLAKVREYRQQNEKAILTELVNLLSIPNLASQKADVQKNADLLLEMLNERGLTNVQLLEAGGSPPAVYGELRVTGATRTIVFYMHYDGQPVNPENWTSDPWQPIFRDKLPSAGGKAFPLAEISTPIDTEWRLYARSASDDKSPIIAALTALDALRNADIPLSVNVKFFLEGEEEAGSPNLEQILTKHASLLKADAWIFCDGPVHQTRRKLIAFGARGVTGVHVTTYGPNRPLHSGHYGNWAPNPIVLLANLISSMRDSNGKILIAGFYDDVRPITDTERRALAASPNIDDQLKSELGLAWSEGEGRLEKQIMLPALNLRNINSGGVAARNAIQTEATAVIGFRLVPDQTREKVRERVERHIREQGFHIVYEEPSEEIRGQNKKIIRLQWGAGYEPFRTSMDLAVSVAVSRVVEESSKIPIVKQPTLGGSLPLHIFDQTLRTPLIIVPMVNHDNNQHAENENLRIQNLWEGIDTYANLLARLGYVWEGS